ncbi:DarT ssDNA thymidine ADP-ribosyltransferase family protein [Oceanobacillus kimchii]|uniref:DarT ssDNA thymidine ADP-ribosyltransferase family protein n=1 Tax=Oceanobacillus kimchii TaxID=746691 RepID=UPI003C78B622
MRGISDLNKIDGLVESLCKDNSVNKNIPKYLYHFSDIENIVSIINTNYLASRNYALEHGLMKNDNASSEVINQTIDDNKNYVRFYFRPKTPTQYRNEGLKSNYKSYEFKAHCPVPIFLVFNSKKILGLKESKFVETNLALNPKICTSIDELEKFDFERIFHLGATNDREIFKKRHAEVLLKDKCNLDHLEFLVCRSYAEKETLLNLLGEKNITLDKKVRVDSKGLFFNKERAYIESIKLENNRVEIQHSNFNSLTNQDNLYIEYIRIDTDEKFSKNLNPSNINTPLILRLKDVEKRYKLKVFLNNKLIYCGIYDKSKIGSNLPF